MCVDFFILRKLNHVKYIYFYIHNKGENILISHIDSNKIVNNIVYDYDEKYLNLMNARGHWTHYILNLGYTYDPNSKYIFHGQKCFEEFKNFIDYMEEIKKLRKTSFLPYVLRIK